MFTGGFKSMSRSEAKTIAESKGGKVLGSSVKKIRFFSCRSYQTYFKKNKSSKGFKDKNYSRKGMD